MVGLLAVRISAAIIRGKVHAAALAIMLGHLQKVRQRLAGDGGDELHHVDPGRNFPALPAAHGLARHKELACKHLLRKAMRSTYGNKVLGKGHSGSPSSEFLDSASLSGAGSQSKQPFVARGKLAYNWAKPLGPIAPL